MRQARLCRTVRHLGLWAYLVICLAVILGGCQSQEAPLNKNVLACKQELLGEMHKLTAALTEPAAKQDWGAVETILQTSYEKMEKDGKFVPFRIAVLDVDGITQGMFPPKKGEPLDFRNYEPAKIVFDQKRKTQARLYLEGKKIFIFMAPLLQKDQVTGAVVMGFSEAELQKRQVPEKEFLAIDFNQ